MPLLFSSGEKKIERICQQKSAFAGFLEDNMGSPWSFFWKRALPIRRKNKVLRMEKGIALIRRLFQDRETGGMARLRKFRKMPAIQRDTSTRERSVAPLGILKIGHHILNSFGGGR